VEEVVTRSPKEEVMVTVRKTQRRGGTEEVMVTVRKTAEAGRDSTTQDRRQAMGHTLSQMHDRTRIRAAHLIRLCPAVLASGVASAG
jgi:hypothetical protein